MWIQYIHWTRASWTAWSWNTRQINHSQEASCCFSLSFKENIFLSLACTVIPLMHKHCRKIHQDIGRRCLIHWISTQATANQNLERGCCQLIEKDSWVPLSSMTPNCSKICALLISRLHILQFKNRGKVRKQPSPCKSIYLAEKKARPTVWKQMLRSYFSTFYIVQNHRPKEPGKVHLLSPNGIRVMGHGLDADSSGPTEGSTVVVHRVANYWNQNEREKHPKVMSYHLYDISTIP